MPHMYDTEQRGRVQVCGLWDSQTYCQATCPQYTRHSGGCANEILPDNTTRGVTTHGSLGPVPIKNKLSSCRYSHHKGTTILKWEFLYFWNGNSCIGILMLKILGLFNFISCLTQDCSNCTTLALVLIHRYNFFLKSIFSAKFSCRKTSNISCTLVDNTIVDHSDVVWASPVGAAPTTSSLST